jgi:hypothetical protein
LTLFSQAGLAIILLSPSLITFICYRRRVQICRRPRILSM